MRKNYGQPDDEIATYVEKIFVPEDQFLKDLRSRTREEGLPDIHVAPMDGLHLEVLAAASGAKKAVEIGTLAGYSGVRILRGMGIGGFLHTFELDGKHLEVAQKHFAESGYENFVKIWHGPALENLKKIEDAGPFDLVFIDADKMNYVHYFEWAARNLRVGGMLIGDNCFAFGMIADKNFQHPNNKKIVESIREFNLAVARHTSFRATMLPTGEGMLIATKVRDV